MCEVCCQRSCRVDWLAIPSPETRLLRKWRNTQPPDLLPDDARQERGDERANGYESVCEGEQPSGPARSILWSGVGPGPQGPFQPQARPRTRCLGQCRSARYLELRPDGARRGSMTSSLSRVAQQHPTLMTAIFPCATARTGHYPGRHRPQVGIAPAQVGPSCAGATLEGDPSRQDPAPARKTGVKSIRTPRL